VISDRHAYLAAANFSNSPEFLAEIDWGRLQISDFRRIPDDPEPFERYQAEALVYQHLPVEHLEHVCCFDPVQQTAFTQIVRDRGLTIEVVRETTWYC
jgi:hypothetical protein